MFRRRIADRTTTQDGFTLVELLVVVLIIGILGSIAIPAFFGQRQRAQDQAAKSLVRNGVVAAETYLVDSPNQNYGGMLPALLTLQEQNVTWVAAGADLVDNEIQVAVFGTLGAENSYSLATRSQTGRWFIYLRAGTGVAYRCQGTAPPVGPGPALTGCAGTYSGTW